MSQLKRCERGAVRCRADKKTLASVRFKVLLMQGYRATGRLNLQIAEECVPTDNEALSVGEQKLTECEQK